MFLLVVNKLSTKIYNNKLMITLLRLFNRFSKPRLNIYIIIFINTKPRLFFKYDLNKLSFAHSCFNKKSRGLYYYYIFINNIIIFFNIFKNYIKYFYIIQPY